MADGRSVLDLFGPGFTLLAAETAPALKVECLVHILPPASAFATLYGVEAGGCVLIRPDGYVAARWQQAPAAGMIEKTLTNILRPNNQ